MTDVRGAPRNLSELNIGNGTRGSDWQVYDEFGSPPLVPPIDPAAVAFDNLPGYGQTQPCPATLSGVKELEQGPGIFRTNSRAGISNPDKNLFPFFTGPQVNDPFAHLFSTNGILCVNQEVQYGLLQ